MYIIRNVFRAKPGKAKDLVAKFKAAAPHLRDMGIVNTRILTDTVAGFWTVVVESEADDLSAYMARLQERPDNPELAAAMAGYMDLVDGGHREILKVE